MGDKNLFDETSRKVIRLLIGIIGEDGHLEIQFTFSDKDQERMRAMEADVRRLAEHLGLWRRGCELTWLPHGSAHLVGTCRMGRPGMVGVADTQGRVHGFDNLYIATVGLFPTPVAVRLRRQRPLC